MAERTKKTVKRPSTKKSKKVPAKKAKATTTGKKSLKAQVKGKASSVKKQTTKAKKVTNKTVSTTSKKSGSKKFEGQLRIMEAVEQLSEFVQVFEKPSKALKSKRVNVLTEDKKGKDQEFQNVTNAFKTVHAYMKHLCRKGKKELKGLKAQRGVKAIMLMACEAEKKIRSLDEKKAQTSLDAFQKLCNFYQEKMVKRFQQQMSADDLWEEEWEGGNMNLDLEHKGLKDLNAVKRDDSYELFYLKQDDGSPFFNRTLLRHIKLVHEFDESFQNALEDPLLKIHRYKDVLVHQMALSIKKEVKEKAEAFYKEIVHHKKIDIIKKLHSMLLSLLMSCKNSSLAKNTAQKTSTEYFSDFIDFFRSILSMNEYQQIIHGEMDETDALSKVIFDLIFQVSYSIYTNENKACFIKDFVNPIMHYQGVSKWRESLNSLHIPEMLSELSETQDIVSKHLNLFPSGPLLKSFDLLSNPGKTPPFDPFLLSNYPGVMFCFKSGDEVKNVLKIPSPTTQHYTSKAEMLDEFIAFLHALESKGESLLYINLQNSLSWKEHARCQEISRVGCRKEYEKAFNLISLNKGSEFYNQAAEYEKMDSSKQFMAAFDQQLLSTEGSGYNFSKAINSKDFSGFIKKLLPLIHTLFFNKESKLERKDRMDFIEIAYLLITLKVIELLNPDHISFSCKDGVDKGMNFSFSFFLMIKILSGSSTWKKGEVDDLLGVLFRPALLVRERTIDPLGFHRASSAIFIVLQSIYAKKSSPLREDLESLYPKGFIKNLKLN
ncbi:hypothetical protein COB21_03585 [Candidatus Aerophobetes bacterium]|uniref:Uncharacterized protein n=1 Tax=Aerophobetes bacterium TaxID=2030807 RepID=A0A2A4X3C3_UNCAE|nr:MAG: hypothetical protein COB21_03585 [Candidatus Aerophobetes bacterium]